MSFRILEESPSLIRATVKCDHCGTSTDLYLPAPAADHDHLRTAARLLFSEHEIIATDAAGHQSVVGIAHLCFDHLEDGASPVAPLTLDLPIDWLIDDSHVRDLLDIEFRRQGAHTFTARAPAPSATLREIPDANHCPLQNPLQND